MCVCGVEHRSELERDANWPVNAVLIGFPQQLQNTHILHQDFIFFTRL